MRILLAVCLAFLSVSTAPSAEMRQWTSLGGGFSVEAELVHVKDENVVLRRKDGKEITVPLAKLSLSDVQYVTKVLKQAPAPSRESRTRPPPRRLGQQRLRAFAGQGPLGHWIRISRPKSRSPAGSSRRRCAGLLPVGGRHHLAATRPERVRCQRGLPGRSPRQRRPPRRDVRRDLSARPEHPSVLRYVARTPRPEVHQEVFVSRRRGRSAPGDRQGWRRTSAPCTRMPPRARQNKRRAEAPRRIPWSLPSLSS